MGSKGHLQPHLWRPLPGPGMMHPDPFIAGVHPPPGPFFDMLPPPEIMEHKLAAQHVEMQRLANENQRLAATHVTLRQELAAAQQELQRLQTQMNVMKAEKEQQMNGLMGKIAKMEVDLQSFDTVNMELQQAHAEAQNLVAVRQDLSSKVQQLTLELQQSHADVQQIPALMSELEHLRREYHDCRMTYDYERKLYGDHLESLQVMERNYISMSREVEKLRNELAKSPNLDRRSGGQYGTNAAYHENDTPALNTSAKLSVDGYNTPQGRQPHSGADPFVGGPGGAASTRMGYDTSRGAGYEVPRAVNYDASRGRSYDASRGGTAYDASRGAGGGYDSSRGAGASYDTPRGASARYDAARGAGAGYDASRASAYDAHRGFALGYDATGASGYDVARIAGYDVARGPGGASAAAGVPVNNAAYGSTQPVQSGEAPHGGNAVHR